MRGTATGLAALAGVAAAGMAIGAAEAVAAVTGSRSAPLIAVGGAVVDSAPAPLKRFAIDTFGTYDKPALLIGTAVLLAGFAAAIGVLGRRWLWAGLLGVAAFGVLGVVAALTRPGAGPVAALPSLVGAVLAGVTLWALLAGPLALPATRAGPASGIEPAVGIGRGPAVGAVPVDDRRRFLRSVGLLAAVAAAGGAAGRWVGSRRQIAAARSAVALPAPASPAPPLPGGAVLSQPGLSSYFTPNGSFYRIDTALVLPQVDPQAWRLRVHGRVGRPLTITFAELLDRPMIERDITLACVSNEVGGDLIGNARWLGVPVRDLLDEAEPLPGADQVVSRSVDGWTCGTPTEVLRDGRDAMLAVGMNGEPLPVEHGFPVRMVVPGLYGYVSACKWLAELELTSFADFDAYWVRRGWAARAPVKTQSRIDTPREGRTIPAGTIMVAGVAWAQHRGIRRVEVRVDGGPWQAATVAAVASRDTWLQWYWRWSATPGRHTLQVRATDADGEVQTGLRRPVEPDGATGWHTVRVEVT